MKKILPIAAVLFLFGFSVNAWAIPCDGIYVGAFGGANFTCEIKRHQFGPEAEFNGFRRYGMAKMSFEQGYNGGVSIGYRFPSNYRVEAEISYRCSKIKSFRFAGLDIPLSGKLHLWSGYCNALWDIPLVCGTRAYIGGGFGYSAGKGEVSWEDISVKIGQGKQGLASQFIAGMSCSICESTEIGVEYRYLHANAFTNANAQCVFLALRTYF